MPDAPRARRRLPPVVAAMLAVAAPVGAEIVVFDDGGFLPVAGYAVDGQRVELELASGGRLVVALSRIERILDDEVAPRGEEPPPEPRGFPLAFVAGDRLPQELPYAPAIQQAAERHALNPALVAAVVRAESAFEPSALSVKGARGLMQLMPATARRFGLDPDEAFVPEKNLDAGARYLRWLADRFDGDLALVLAAYNAGEGTVERFGGVPPYRETRAYLRRVYATLGLDAALAAAVPGGR